ncbi:MAG TPA: phosphotransferase [Pyrinomonadaceae bacterium]
MHLLEYTPRFNVESAAAIADRYFGIRASASPLPSERDQNFLLTNSAREKFVLKIANALEAPEFLEAQNLVFKHLATRVSFCQRVVAETVPVKGENGATHFARVVQYLPGVPLAQIKPQSSELLRDLGRKLGQLDRALADFDHPAVHRDFHWDLANGNRIVRDYGKLIRDPALRELVSDFRIDFDTTLRRSVIHGDANDYNVLVNPNRMTVVGLLDFGDMVHSYTVGNLAIAIAYVVLDKADPITTARDVVEGYTSEFPLLENEIEAVWPLVLMRLCMSVCMAAYQRQQNPEKEYLQISQQSIEQNLPRLFAIQALHR